MTLSNLTCKNARPASKMYKLSDRNGLHLRVETNGSKLWRYSYRFNGRQKDLALGKFPTVSLVDAREQRDAAERLIRLGTDPSVARKQNRLSSRSTFTDLANEYLEKQRLEGRADATLAKDSWLLEHAIREFCSRSIDSITPIELIDLAKTQFQNRARYDSAHRLLTTLNSVFRLAVQSGRLTHNPAADRRGALIKRKHRHHSSVTDPKKLGEVLRAIDAYEGQPLTVAALKLLPILFLRPGELRAGQWSELNFSQAVWTVSAARTKNRKQLQVPLAPQAIAILQDVKTMGYRSPCIFPSLRALNNPNGAPMSENTLNAAFRIMGYGADEITSHGFRSTASTLLNTTRLFDPDVIERQLNHVERNEVRGAYNHATHWDERVRMMNWWADHLDGLKRT